MVRREAEPRPAEKRHCRCSTRSPVETLVNVSREQFNDELRELSATVAQKSDGQMTAGLLRVAAMERDSRTSVFHALNILPIEVTWFQEGLFITAAMPEFSELIGA